MAHRVNKALIQFEDRAVDINSEQDRKFINDQKLAYAAERDVSATEAKEGERALCSQLMLVTTVLLTASVVVLSDSSLFTAMTNAQKAATFIGVVTLGCSILAGIRYYFVLTAFYNEWADAKNELVRYFGEIQFKTFSEARREVQRVVSKIDAKASRFWLRAQIALLVCGFVAYLALVAGIFFNFTWITNPSSHPSSVINCL